MNRRQSLLVGVGALIAGTRRSIAQVISATNNIEEIIEQFTGGRNPEVNFVNLDLPPTSENGSMIPMTVKVDRPMTEQQFVSSVLVATDGNARATIVTFYFSPASGVAEASTRIRLETKVHNVTAVARMNDGTCFKATNRIEVTSAGCS